MQSSGLRAQLESALSNRVPTPFTDIAGCGPGPETVSTGIPELDVLTGGLPRGAITEIHGPPSSGRTSFMLSLLAKATARDEVCALVDGGDAFDPLSGAAAGVDLKRLLWTRCATLGQVLKTTDLLVQGGGFGVVVMDLSDISERETQTMPPSAWFRFQRAIEKTPTMLVVVGLKSMVKSAAALALRLERHGFEWRGSGKGAPPHAVLTGANRIILSFVRAKRRG